MGLPVQFNAGILEAGLDEAGRGCLAGPVVAAAVILPEGFSHEWLTDSKQLNAAQRAELRAVVLENALAYAVAEVNHARIDEINILNASFEAMHIAVGQLALQPDALLVDGNRFKRYGNIPHTCMVEGDGRFLNIAAASILAKTHRDALMSQLHEEFPHYGWARNKGYPTPEHRRAIGLHGFSPYHRLTFNANVAELTLF